uniref:Uncharacterized protein n=1 Tax=Siphoviridae sp. ctB3v5 TaxID=2826186 RepID=A0A8S5M914_9CAUD|nr:MAG TPA: hypothetical protein [Siphoviridae sp. ctB3v5]
MRSITCYDIFIISNMSAFFITYDFTFYNINYLLFSIIRVKF